MLDRLGHGRRTRAIDVGSTIAAYQKDQLIRAPWTGTVLGFVQIQMAN